LSEIDRKAKFGYLTRWSPNEKTEWKQNVMFKTGMFKWQKQRADREGILLNRVMEDRNNFKNYEKLVVHLTNKTYQKYRNEIDPLKLRGTNWHLDHIYSKAAGFQNNVDPYIISSKYNLQILPAKDNLLKNFTSEISLEELMEKYHG
jgi:hypothetical protein